MIYLIYLIYLLSACMIAAWVLAVIDLASTDWDYEPEEYRHTVRGLYDACI